MSSDFDIHGFKPRTLIKWALIGALLLVPVVAASSALGWCTSAVRVVREEVDPRTVLDRYQWFIEQWHAIQEQDATLDVFRLEVAAVKRDYGEKPPRDVRRDLSLQRAEARGMLANRNRLAREYRAAIQKINYVPATMLPHFPATVPDYSLK